MKPLKKRHQPTLEPLEARQLLAGNILIETSDGNLVITGDALPNSITITQTGLGQFAVTGNDGEQFRTPGGNFQKSPVTVANVRGGLLVSLGSGDDSVNIQGISSSCPIGEFLTVMTGPGQDRVEIRKAQTGDPRYPPQIKIPVELKRQRAAIGEAAFWNATATGSLTIDTGAGDKASDGDTVTIHSVTIQGPTMIETGAGDDQISLDDFRGRQAGVYTSSGADHVAIALKAVVSVDSLTMNLGDQDDRVEIGTGPLTLTGMNLSKFEGGRGLNILTGYSNLDTKTRRRLVDPRTTGFVVDPLGH